MTVSISNAQGHVLTAEPKKMSIAETHGYVLHASPRPLVVRQLAGYAVAALAAPTVFRQIAGYAVTSGGEVIKGKTGADAVMDAILVQSKTTRPKTHFTLGQPETFAFEQGLSYNARVKLTPTLAAKLKGEMYFHYNRNHIGTILKDPSLVLVRGKTQTHDLIAGINAATGMILTTADIVNEVIPAGVDTIMVKAAETSYMFAPGTTVQVGLGEVAGDPWMLVDVNSLTELQGTNSVVTATGATADSSFMIDGEPSLKIAAGGSLKIDFGQIFDSSIPEWTLEWSSRLNATTTVYANLFMLTTSGALPGFIQRASDSGFGNRIQQGFRTTNAGDVNNFPFADETKLNVLTRYAAVKKNGVVKMYVDGVQTNMANGAGNTYSVVGIPDNFNTKTLNQLVIGGLAQQISHIRISKFARYNLDYTPKPLKAPSLPSFDSFIPVGQLSGFEPEA